MADRPIHFHLLLLTRDHCGFCEQARDILERVAQEYSLSYTTHSWDSLQGQQLALQGGLLFPPGVLIDGEPFSYGRLSERKLRHELDRRESLLPISTCQAPEETPPVGKRCIDRGYSSIT